MASRPSAPPTRRADAERNRQRILAAARAAFAEDGGAVSMAAISRRAGVGMATLYRNFPGRRELLEALYVGEVDDICAAASATAGETPGASLEAWLHRFGDFFASKHGIGAELLEQADGDPAFLDRGRDRVLVAGRPLLAAAQGSGEVRDDLALEQVLDLVIAVAKIGGDPAYRAPILRAALDGIRRPSG